MKMIDRNDDDNANDRNDNGNDRDERHNNNNNYKTIPTCSSSEWIRGREIDDDVAWNSSGHPIEFLDPKTLRGAKT